MLKKGWLLFFLLRIFVAKPLLTLRKEDFLKDLEKIVLSCRLLSSVLDFPLCFWISGGDLYHLHYSGVLGKI